MSVISVAVPPTVDPPTDSGGESWTVHSVDEAIRPYPYALCGVAWPFSERWESGPVDLCGACTSIDRFLCWFPRFIAVPFLRWWLPRTRKGDQT